MAGESTLSLTYKDLLTSTLFGYLDSGKFTDNISDITPTWGWLMDEAENVSLWPSNRVLILQQGPTRIMTASTSRLKTT